MANFAVPVDGLSEKGSRSFSSSDVNLSDYLEANRKYADSILRPVLIETKDSSPLVPVLQFFGKQVVASYRQAYYHLEVFSEDIDKFSLYDALNAAMALLQIPEDGDLFLIPIEVTNIDDQRMDERVLLSRRNAAVGLPGPQLYELGLYDSYTLW